MRCRHDEGSRDGLHPRLQWFGGLVNEAHSWADSGEAPLAHNNWALLADNNKREREKGVCDWRAPIYREPMVTGLGAMSFPAFASRKGAKQARSVR